MLLKIASVLILLLFIAGCGGSNAQNSQLFKLPSGKEIKVTGMNKMAFQNGDTALILNYETDGSVLILWCYTQFFCEKRPLLRQFLVLFTSGYTNSVVSKHGISETKQNFIQKPFTFEVLSKKVREISDDVNL